MDKPKKLYRAIVWLSGENKDGIRLEIWAEDSEAALKVIESKYGKEVVTTLYNEEDANRVR